MSYFLLVYDRRRGKLKRQPKQFSSAQLADAVRERFALERKYASDKNTEIVLLGGDSIATLRRTHGRYFKSFRELLAS
jgi:hypothetical protein